jgi:hypothetical protein
VPAKQKCGYGKGTQLHWTETVHCSASAGTHKAYLPNTDSFRYITSLMIGFHSIRAIDSIFWFSSLFKGAYGASCFFENHLFQIWPFDRPSIIWTPISNCRNERRYSNSWQARIKKRCTYINISNPQHGGLFYFKKRNLHCLKRQHFVAVAHCSRPEDAFIIQARHWM